MYLRILCTIQQRALGLAALLALCGVPTLHAQTAATVTKVDTYTPDELTQRALKLKARADADGTGVASVVLARYPGHFTMLGFRDKPGGAELDTEAADIDVILDGTATLITGGPSLIPKPPHPAKCAAP